MIPDHDFPGPDDERPARKAHEILLTSIDTTPARCRSCQARVVWARTQKNGKPVLLDVNARRVARPLAGGVGFAISSEYVHFATCPNAAQHRRDGRTAPSERID